MRVQKVCEAFVLCAIATGTMSLADAQPIKLKFAVFSPTQSGYSIQSRSRSRQQ
jgi:hypothetical protein